MRMWGIPTKLLCAKHLLGEHVEMHMFEGTIKKNRSITGYIEKGLVNPSKINQRHDELAQEMLDRGYTHGSPMEMDMSKNNLIENIIDIEQNKIELQNRCEQCKRIQNYYNEKKIKQSPQRGGIVRKMGNA